MTDRAEEVSTAATLPRKGRSNEELAMRDLIAPKLRSAYPGARIIHELPLRYSSNRIDMAAVTDDQIISVEIKSSHDTTERLAAQIRAFLPVSSRLIVALAPRWNEKLPWKDVPCKHGTAHVQQYTEAQEIIRGIGGSIETWTVCSATGLVEKTDGTWYDPQRPWSIRMLDMMWRAELLQIAFEHRVHVPPRARHTVIRDACEEVMTGREVRKAACSALRSRDAFDKMSDSIPVPPVQIPLAEMGGGKVKETVG